jgi:hypothetical protein
VKSGASGGSCAGTADGGSAGAGPLRISAHQRSQLNDRRAVAAELDLDLHPALDGHDEFLVGAAAQQTAQLIGEGAVEHRAAPQLASPRQQFRGGRGGAADVGQQVPEAEQVDRRARHVDRVAVADPDDRRRVTERRTQPGHRDLNGVAGGPRRLLAQPDQVGDPVGLNRAARVQQQNAQHHPMPPVTDRDPVSVDPDFELTEQLDVQAVPGRHTPSRPCRPADAARRLIERSAFLPLSADPISLRL